MRPRLAALIEVGLPLISFAWMTSVLVPFSLKVIFSLSPRSRLMPLNEASSDSLSSWSFSSLNCLTRFVRTSLPSTESVLAEPSSVLVVPLAPPTVRSVVERFWMRSLPPSFDAVTLPVKAEVPLIAATS